MVLGIRCDVDIYKRTASAKSIYREVNSLNVDIHAEHAGIHYMTVSCHTVHFITVHFHVIR